MDYELLANGNIRIGQKAPNFSATTTYGNKRLEDYKGKWLVFFSHPGDFTPVCTTEMIAFSKYYNYFTKINTELLGLSVDSNSSHLAWINDIYLNTGVKIPFPIIADRSGEIARLYGMISKEVSNVQTVRNVIIINDKGIIKAILIYPLNVGRAIPEILRIVKALQMADYSNGYTPANWIPGQPLIIPPPLTFKELEERQKYIEENNNGISWYLSFKEPLEKNKEVMCDKNEENNDK